MMPWEEAAQVLQQKPVAKSKQLMPWEEAALVVGSAPQESTGQAVGRNIKAGIKRFGEDLIGTPEALATMATGALAFPVAKAFGATTYLNRAMGRTTRDPGEAAEDIQTALTYQPRTDGGKRVLGALGTVMTPLTAVGEFAGDVSKGMGGDKYVSDLTRDVATLAAGGAAAKAIPPVVNAAMAVPKQLGRAGQVTGEVGKNAYKIASEIYTPERQLAVAGGHLLAGDVLGAGVQGGIGLARMKAASMKAAAADAVAAGVNEVATGGAKRVITPSISAVEKAVDTSSAGESLLSRITTKGDYAAIKEAVAMQRAEAMAARAERMPVIPEVIEAAPVLAPQTPASIGAALQQGARSSALEVEPMSRVNRIGSKIVNVEPGVGPAAPKRGPDMGLLNMAEEPTPGLQPVNVGQALQHAAAPQMNALQQLRARVASQPKPNYGPEFDALSPQMQQAFIIANDFVQSKGNPPLTVSRWMQLQEIKARSKK